MRSVKSAVKPRGGNSGLPNDWDDSLLNMADNGRTEEEPLLLSIAGYQILAYEGTNGIRPQIAAQRFQTVPELEGAVRQILRVLQILRPT
jgi:hypothetical protein